MRFILSKVGTLAFCLAFLVTSALAQTQINPATQVRWPVSTGTVDPAPPTWVCAAANYGQPYTNTATGKQFTCAAGGWVNVAAAAVPGGANQDVQINLSSVFGADHGVFTYNTSTHTLGTQNQLSSSVQSKLTNSLGNTDLYATGAGNNGIANFFSTFTQGVATVPPGSTDTEPFNTPIPEQSILFDYRKNQITRTFHSTGQNNLTNFPQCGNNSFPQGGTGICNVYNFDLPNVSFSGHAQTFTANSPGFNFGSPATTSANGWTTYFANFNTDFFNTRGIKEDFATNINDNAVGDFAASAINVHTNGGATEPSSEGAELVSWHITENTSYFHGTCSSGCTTGSNSLITTYTSGNNAFTDGSYLLDTTQSPLTTTVSSIAYPNGFMAYNFGTSILTTSTAWGTITATVNAPNFQTPVSQTVTATLNVGGTNSPNPYAVGSNACLVGAPGNSGGFMEQVQITAVGTATTTQSVTFNSRYGYNAGSLLMQGSACGYYVTSNTSWQPAAMVIGAFSPTQAVIGACLGACTETAASSLTDMVKTEVGNVGATVNLYQGAEIIGTNKGTANNVQLATNTVSFAVNDVLIDPHPLAVLESAGIIQIAQTTPINDNFGNMFNLWWAGPAVGRGMYGALFGANINSIMDVTATNSATYNYFLQSTFAPQQAVINLPGTTSYYLFLTSNNSIYSIANSGGFIFGDRTNNGLVPLQALNIPTTPTVLGQIPIASSLSVFNQDYTATTVSGDCTLSSIGAMTCTKSSGNPIVTGSGTTGYLPMFTAGGAVGNSHCDDGVTAAGTITCTEPLNIVVTYPSYASYKAGTGNIPALAANSAGFAAPVTGGTSWLGKLPATITAGLLHFAAPAVGDGVNESVMTSGPVGLATSDVSGVLPIANGGTGGNGEAVITFSATPTFVVTAQLNTITLTANVTSFTVPAGTAGQQLTINWCQNGTGGFTVAGAPANLHGFTTPGTTASKCSVQTFVYSGNQTAWLATAAGALNE